MKYHALSVIFEKAAEFLIVVCCKFIGGALRVINYVTSKRLNSLITFAKRQSHYGD